MGRDLESGLTAQGIFAAELVRLRQQTGLSQIALGARIGCHRTLISHIERGEKKPQRKIAEALDVAFELTDKKHFTGLYERLIREIGSLGWFGRWLEVEPQATYLRFWDPLLVPGILQTEAYARAIYQREPSLPANEVEQRVSARMERRSILRREVPPRVWVMIDETVLHRPIGGRAVLAGQLRFLLEMADHPAVTIQVVPIDAGCAPGLLSAFALAQLPNDMQVATIQSSGDGVVTTEPRLLSRLTLQCDIIRDDAYSQSESLRLIERVMEQ
ncbi:helix-turn-helix transcriptional regulator [Spongiactinospora sp. TRM90649]|uniref:helix-turn-helix domain-containing protein n=1 Tax=Spongiactinospora sp. TRM90649 TaxID=3031114 RepID=UPI0023FA455E|nr:helix-turn-helix transcriptional regulator [Spongiactinospora sp. TRM90649]MDF5752185.1 helix-turn-helix transcriptional regulator [Spongiactinospora sp. TRM90649]